MDAKVASERAPRRTCSVDIRTGLLEYNLELQARLSTENDRDRQENDADRTVIWTLAERIKARDKRIERRERDCDQLRRDVTMIEREGRKPRAQRAA